MKILHNFSQEQHRLVRTIALLLLSWLGTWGISYVCSLTAGSSFSNSIASLAVVIALYQLWSRTCDVLVHITASKDRKRRCFYGILLAYLLSLSLIMGYQLKGMGITDYGIRGKLLLLIRALPLSCAVFPFTDMLVALADRIYHRVKPENVKPMWRSRNVFLISWLVMFLCWIPVFLAYYPGILSYDFHRQSQEAMKGFEWFNSHHPLVHTWLIWLFLQLGQALGSLHTGMALYSIFQMLILSAALAYSAVTIYRLCRKRSLLTAIVIFYALFPFISVLAVSVTKDIIFTALFLVFVLLLVERTLFCKGKTPILLDIALVLEGILMMLFRNNALYALAPFCIFFLLFGAGNKRGNPARKPEQLRILLLCVILVVGGKLAPEGVMLAIGTDGRGSEVEKYSVLIQQFARVGYYHDEQMEPYTRALLCSCVSDAYWDNYNPPISDTVKASVAVDNFPKTWENNMPYVLQTWATIGLQYPNEYIDAFLYLTNGYWFLDDVTWCEVLGYGTDTRMGALYTYNASVSDVIPEGIAQESKLPGLEHFLETIVSGNSFYNIPVLSNLFKPAFYCWILLAHLILLFYTRQKKLLMLTLLPVFYLLTLLLGPVVQVRYLLPVMVTLPVLLAARFLPENTTD